MSPLRQSKAHHRTNRLLFALVAVALLVLLCFTGNTHRPDMYGDALLTWLVRQWLTGGSHSSHGFLILMVSGWLLWRERKALATLPRAPDSRGLPIIVAALVMYWIGCRAQQPRLGVIAVILLAWSIPLFLTGSQVAGKLLFPCGYLLFAIPMGFLTAATFPLRLVSCAAASTILNGLNIAVLREGSAMHLLGDAPISLDVADPCSGLQSIIALSALSAAYAYLSQSGLLRRTALFLAALPIAVMCNIIRIVSIGIIASVFNQEVALRVYHSFSGYIIFASAILMMMGTSALLKKTQNKKATAKQTETDVPPGKGIQPNYLPRLATLSALLLIGIVLVELTGDTRRLREPGVNADLPAEVGAWRGRPIYYCHNDSCISPSQREENHDNPGTCTHCGDALYAMSPAEAASLPHDTLIARKRYTVNTASVASITVTIVMQGLERASLHPPQWCLPGQGYSITETKTQRISLADDAELSVRLLRLGFPLAEQSPSTRVSRNALFAYWYAAGRHETPYRLQRLIRIALDGVLHGVIQRWAYISVMATSGIGEDELAAFIRHLHPALALGGGSAQD